MAFGPGGAYFLSGAAAQGPYGASYGAENTAAANQRSASLPAYLPKAFSAAPFAATMPGLQEGASCTVPTAACCSTWSPMQSQASNVFSARCAVVSIVRLAEPLFAGVPGVAYSGEAQQHNDVGAHRRGSCEFHGTIGSELPPKAPASRRFSMDSSTCAQVRLVNYKHLQMLTTRFVPCWCLPFWPLCQRFVVQRVPARCP